LKIIAEENMKEMLCVHLCEDGKIVKNNTNDLAEEINFSSLSNRIFTSFRTHIHPNKLAKLDFKSNFDHCSQDFFI
jgi:hypothetical protein